MNHPSFTDFWQEDFAALHIQELDKRWVKPEEVDQVLQMLPKEVAQAVIGHSAEKRPIYKLAIGTGAKHVLAWAAMHGNESTAMRGWLDLFLNINNADLKTHWESLLAQFTIHFIPMLNPDGAERYTRRNAMNIDMNRDARAWQTPEMKVLKAQIDEIQPVLAFNLHDQRNIFAVKGKPTTISFLAPSMDVARSVTPERAIAMDLIGAASKALAPFLVDQMGRYSDEYYPTAVGEYIQKRGIPTILVECGAAYNDSARQVARMANSIILFAVLQQFTSVTKNDTSAYNAIQVNETNQVDILIKGLETTILGQKVVADLALLAEESIVNGVYAFTYKVNDYGDLPQVIALETHQWLNTISLGSVAVNAIANLDIETNLGTLRIANGLKK